MIKVQEVADAGFLLRISLTQNGVETHFHTVSKNDSPELMKKKRKELLALAEFTSLN